MADHVPAKILRALDDRDAPDGRVCVMTGQQSDRIVPQHRQGGMGGRKDKHRLPNLLWLDSILNGHIESNSEWQAVALAWGVKVPVWVDDVTRVPVFFRHEHTWFVLDGDTKRPVPAVVALDMMLEVYGDQYLVWKDVADRTDRSGALLGVVR